MQLVSLSLENIGPFDRANIEFAVDAPRVTLITGINGTGKTIVLDAIRAMFGPEYAEIERPIWRERVPFLITLETNENGKPFSFNGTRALRNGLDPVGLPALASLPLRVQGHPSTAPNWVVDFWRSDLATDSYQIANIVRVDPTAYLRGALQGRHRNAAVTELLVYFDYLRGSNDERERADGERLYAIAAEIIQRSLLDGRFSHVRRSDFTPIVVQAGREVSLDKLSSGNAYLIQRLISLLGRMYSVHVLRGTPPEEIGKTPGVLLIDEAENHLHPRWQKRFLRDVLELFPNLEIIATTHSPFILASMPGARVYVCRYDHDARSCVIEEQTDVYANKPVEEILLSPAFDETQPFGPEITKLVEERKAAARRGDRVRQREIEERLKDLNPDYFAYLEVEQQLEKLRKAAP